MSVPIQKNEIEDKKQRKMREKERERERERERGTPQQSKQLRNMVRSHHPFLPWMFSGMGA
jgi:hypothetical protein